MARQIVQRQTVSRQRVPRQAVSSFSTSTVYRAPSRSETINYVSSQLNINPSDYNFSFYDSGMVKSIVSNPQQYTQKKDTRTKMVERGQVYQYGSFIPVEYRFSPSGALLQKIVRDVYTKDTSSYGYTKAPFIKQIIDYSAGTERRYQTRSLSGGRESVKLVYDLKGGKVKEYQIQPYKPPKQRELEAEAAAAGVSVQDYISQEAAKVALAKERSQQMFRMGGGAALISYRPSAEKIAEEKSKMILDLYEKQARSKIERGLVKPDSSGKVSVTVGGIKFNYVVSENAPSAKTRQKALDRAEYLVKSGYVDKGKFIIKEGGFNFVFEVNPKTEKIGSVKSFIGSYGTITQEKPPKSMFEAINLGLSKEQDRLLTKVERNKASVSDQASLFVVSLLSNLVKNVKAVREIPGFIKEIYTNPSVLKNFPSALKKSFVDFGKLVKVSPTSAMGVVAGEFIFLRGTGKAIEIVSEIPSSILRLSPKFVGSLKSGRVLSLVTDEGEKVVLKVVSKIPLEKLSDQIKRVGKNINAVSSQADSLINIIKSSRVIRKPIRNIERLSNTGKKLLEKFDKGKISLKELNILDKEIKKIRSKGILERSFFADPSLKIRPSRFGISKQQRAKLLDYLSGDYTFRSSKPQILLFVGETVEKVPKSLKSILNKISKGKSISEAESLLLLKFQLSRSGKFKPIGFLTRESEVTLAPGELIKKVKRLGFAEIKGKKIGVVQVKIFKPKNDLLELYKKKIIGSIDSKDDKRLLKLLKRETGLNYKFSYSSSNKVIRVSRIGRSSLKVIIPKILSKNLLNKIFSSKELSKLTKINNKIIISSKLDVYKILKSPEKTPLIYSKIITIPISLPPSSPKLIKSPVKPPVKPPVSLPPSPPKLIRTPVKPPKKIITLQDIKEEINKKVSEAKKKRSFIYIPDLESSLYGLKAKKKSDRQLLLLKGRIFSGLERRPIV